MAAIILLVIMVVAPMTGFKNYKHRAREAAARSALMNLARAQDDYYGGHQTYTGNPDDLKAVGWQPDEYIRVKILTAKKESWSGTAAHINSAREFTYSSLEGGMR